MSSSYSKPDLQESINVTKAHARVTQEAAAAARENKINDQGTEPINLWVLAVCGVVLVIAGGILGNADHLFAYDNTFPEHYVRLKAPGAGDTGPQPMDAMAAYKNKGAKIFMAKCSGCHQSDAKGNNNYPSLVGSKFALGETERFSMIILNGLKGPNSRGKAYPGGMPAQLGLSPEELAGVMTYVRNNFGNEKGDVVTVDMAKAAMEISQKREKAGEQVTAVELNADHLKNLPGDPLEPTALVNPVNLAPVEEKPAP